MASDKPTSPRFCLECRVSLAGEHGLRQRCRPCAKRHKLKRKQTPEYKAQQREYAARLRQTEAHQMYIYEYRRTPEAKERARLYMQERRKTEECQEYEREYRRRPEVKAAMQERSRAYNQRPEVREKQRQKERTPEYKARRYKYGQTYLRNPKVKERRREWAREYNQKPEVKRRSAERTRLRKPWDATVTPEAVAAMLKAQRGQCVECRADICAAYHMDHIIPQSKGGPSTLSNLQLLCRTCNISKGAKDPLEFAALKGRLL